MTKKQAAKLSDLFRWSSCESAIEILLVLSERLSTIAEIQQETNSSHANVHCFVARFYRIGIIEKERHYYPSTDTDAILYRLTKKGIQLVRIIKLLMKLK